MGAIGAAGAAGLAGCSGEQGTDTPSDTPSATPTPTDTVGQQTPTTSRYEQLEVGGDLVISTTSTASSLNPFRADDTTTSGRINLLFDYPGGTYDPDTFLPGLFKSWELADSNDVVEYELHEGLEFGDPDGRFDRTELTAEDFIYTLNNLVLLTGDEDWYGYTDTSQYQIGPDSELVSFEKTGKYSLRAELPVTKPTWIHEDPMLFQWVLPKQFIKSYREDEDVEGFDQDEYITKAKYSYGNLGRFEFDRWKRDSEFVVTRNPDWYKREKVGKFNAVDYSKAPYFESVTIQLFEESSTQLSALKSGDIAWAGIPSGKVANFKGKDNDGISTYLSPFDNSVFWLNINHRINGWEPLRNGDHNHDSRKVRYAIGNAYNPETLIEQAHNGLGQRIKTMHARWGPYYPDPDSLASIGGDLEEARQLLEEGTSSDYGYTNDGTFVGPDGEQVRLKGVRTTGTPSIEIEASYTKSRLNKLGIQYDIEALQWSTLLGNYAQNSVSNTDGVSESDLRWGPVGPFNGGPWDQSTSAKDWDLMHGLGFSTSPYAPWGTVRVTMGEQQSFNLWGYHQDELNIGEKVGNLSTAEDKETIQQGMTELFQFLANDQPLIFKYTPAGVTGYRDRVAGIVGERDVDGFDYRAKSYWQDIVFDDPTTLYAFEGGSK